MFRWDAECGAFVGLDGVASHAERPGEVVLAEPKGAALAPDAAPDMSVDRCHWSFIRNGVSAPSRPVRQHRAVADVRRLSAPKRRSGDEIDHSLHNHLSSLT